MSEGEYSLMHNQRYQIVLSVMVTAPLHLPADDEEDEEDGDDIDGTSSRR